MTVEDTIKALMPDGVDGYVKGLGWVKAHGYGGHGSGEGRERYTYAYAMELPENVCPECGIASDGPDHFRHSVACSVYKAWLDGLV